MFRFAFPAQFRSSGSRTNSRKKLFFQGENALSALFSRMANSLRVYGKLKLLKPFSLKENGLHSRLSTPQHQGICSNSLIKTALVAALLSCSAMVSAQSGPAWDVYGGVAVQRYTPLFAPATAYKYGWDFSIAQRAYPSHPWIAGQIEASGVYGSTSAALPGAPAGTTTYTLRSDLYTAMAGPIVYLPLHKLRPFAHVLLGGVITANTVSGVGANATSGTKGYFGTQGGGGIDVRMSHRMWIRGQGDWIRIWQIGDANADTLRLTAGVVYTF